ncbi:MAG: hypothetical protein ACOYON_12345 [Fimbriimonas sp.]
MKLVKLMLLALVAGLFAGCGGGGSSVSSRVTLIGRVLNVESGGATNPASSVQAAGGTVTTSVVDGSFSLSANSPASTLTVDTLSTYGVWIFSFPAVTATTDLGDLYVGPQRVTVTGTVRNASSNDPIAGARVTFAGRSALTSATGVFTLDEVAYSTANPAGFYGIVGSSTAAGFFLTSFTASDKAPISGVVTVDDILMTPASGTTPPTPPYSIWGRVSPSASAPGTIVTLKQGGTPVRIYTVGADGFYYFWVGAGSYTAEYVKGTQTAPTQNITLATSNEVARRDVTLGP